MTRKFNPEKKLLSPKSPRTILFKQTTIYPARIIPWSLPVWLPQIKYRWGAMFAANMRCHLLDTISVKVRYIARYDTLQHTTVTMPTIRYDIWEHKISYNMRRLRYYLLGTISRIIRYIATCDSYDTIY